MPHALKLRYARASGGPSQGSRENAARSWGWAVVLVTLGVLCGGENNPVWGEVKPSDKLLFLVARSSILDPFFERSVVLLVPLKDEPLVVGLVVNKPTRLPLTRLFPKSPGLEKLSENAYLGGPVDMAAPALAFRAQKPPLQAMLLFDDVYLSFDTKFISKLLQDSKQTGYLRLFLGRAQWAPEQLQGEALRGSWDSLRAEGDVIFDRDSEQVWKRLHKRVEAPSSVEDRRPLPRSITGGYTSNGD